MVAKCVNPYCNRPFRYLGRGKLFVTEYPPTLASRFDLRGRTREHFWLCEECARTMTVAVRREHGGITIRIINLPADGRRKLDFEPGSQVEPPATYRRRSFPEAWFDAI